MDTTGERNESLVAADIVLYQEWINAKFSNESEEPRKNVKNRFSATTGALFMSYH